MGAGGSGDRVERLDAHGRTAADGNKGTVKSTTDLAFTALLLAVTLVWGWTFPVVKDAVAAYGVIAFLAIRFALATCAMILTMEPVFATIFGRVLAGDRLTVLQIVGGAVMVAAMLASSIHQAANSASSEREAQRA